MKKTENYAMPYPEQDDYFNVEDFQNMMVSVDNLMKKLSDSGAQISSDAEHLYNQTKAQMDNIQKRMNAFTALRDGSTTGDAELKDIRVEEQNKQYSQNQDTCLSVEEDNDNSKLTKDTDTPK